MRSDGGHALHYQRSSDVIWRNTVQTDLCPTLVGRRGNRRLQSTDGERSATVNEADFDDLLMSTELPPFFAQVDSPKGELGSAVSVRSVALEVRCRD